MEINEQDAFKLGFLTRCAEEKLTGTELEARLDKIAAFNKAAAIGSGYLPSWLTGPVSDITAGYVGALSLPFGLSILGGSGLGYGAAKMVEPRISDEEIKAHELAATYKMYADKAKSRRKAVKYRTKKEIENQTTKQPYDDINSRI
jgi:hypothetical protein